VSGGGVMSEKSDRAPVEVLPTPKRRRAVLVGNPNTGKTTLFNTVCGARQRVSNYPGTTQEVRFGELRESRSADDASVWRLVDLPGVYAIDLAEPESEACRVALESEPDAVLVTLDARNLPRNLNLACELIARGEPVVVLLNMVEAAEKDGLRIDAAALARELGVKVFSARRDASGEGALRAALNSAPRRTEARPIDDLRAWARRAYDAAVRRPTVERARRSDRIDAVVLHPIAGPVIFTLVMTGLFWSVFRIAGWPMGWIEWFFEVASSAASAITPPGAIRDLIAGGIIPGIGGTLVFIPQIAILFFLVTLLEESGYLARAALTLDRWLRPFGLSGSAFVPLLSAHACALPAISAARGIANPRERLAVILTAPFMSCTARIPVYVLLTAVLFPSRPGVQALAFAGCYALGIVAALVTSLLVRGTILRGRPRPMAIELPRYRTPSIVSALRISGERALGFLKKAGTVILAISVVLWWLGAYPNAGASPEGDALRTQAEAAVSTEASESLLAEAEAADAAHAAERTYLARIGGTVQPIFEPLGFDDRLTVGVMASFAAREVFVSTMAVQLAGDEEAEGEGLLESITTATRDGSGALLFNAPTSWALLVYYVLAMQCLPTLVLTARESGGVKWALLQLGWMQALAWVGGAAAFALAGGWSA